VQSDEFGAHQHLPTLEYIRNIISNLDRTANEKHLLSNWYLHQLVKLVAYNQTNQTVTLPGDPPRAKTRLVLQVVHIAGFGQNAQEFPHYGQVPFPWSLNIP